MYDRGLLLSGMLAGGLVLAGSVAAAEPQQVWQAKGLDGPESAVLDAGAGVIYVSNVNGNPSQHDGNGFIEVIRADSTGAPPKILVESGKNGAKPGLFMPAEPRAGVTFQQERAPGVAEDESTVEAIDVGVTTAAGKFKGCVKTKDYAPIDKTTEFKFYCPNVGLVREELEEGNSELVRYG